MRAMSEMILLGLLDSGWTCQPPNMKANRGCLLVKREYFAKHDHNQDGSIDKAEWE